MSDENTQPKPEQENEVKPADVAGKDEEIQSESQPEQKDENIKSEPQPEQKSESKHTDIVGRKVFFLCPSVHIQNQIMDELAQQEFEVYTTKDYAHLTRILKKYPDSIVYVNLDDNTFKNDLEKWIETIYTAVPSVKIGIFSSSTDEEFKNKYIKNPHVACGLINLRLDMNRAPQKIAETLEGLNVKGRRKYLRASTEHETTATINMPHDGNFINGVIKDVSVVGISCVFEHDPGLKIKTLYKDIQIRLQSMLLKAEAVVFGSRAEYGNNIYVLLFTQRISPDVRTKIRKYIQQNLQHKMDSELK